MKHLRELIKPTRYPDPSDDDDDEEEKNPDKDETFEKKPDTLGKNTGLKTESNLTDDKVDRETMADEEEPDDVGGSKGDFPEQGMITNERKIIKKLKSFYSDKSNSPNDSIDDTSNSPMVDEAIHYSDETLLHRSLTPHYQNYTKEETHILHDYSKLSSINSYLWDRHKKIIVKDKNSKNNDLYASKLDSAINRHKTPKNMTVYSGINFNPKDRINSEGIIHHPAYLSTSLKKSIAINFASNHQKLDSEENIHNHVLQIHVPKDHPGAYIGNISNSKEERELLLPKGLNMKLLGYHKKEYLLDKSGKKNIYHFHHMEIV